MVSVSIPFNDEEYSRITSQRWVNWSEIARIIAAKREIFERYKTGAELTKEDIIFCDGIDWHPVDELPLRKEYVERILKISKGRKIRVGSSAELRRKVGL
jgi:hypothetical protein